MNDLEELYQELIIDHSKNPRHFGKLEPADAIKEGFNPLCGDKVMLYLRKKDGLIDQVSFEGCGCAISMASASLMTEAILGKSAQEIQSLFADFHLLVTQGVAPNSPHHLKKLVALAGVSQYPMRVKCATLAWHTTLAALQESN